MARLRIEYHPHALLRMRQRKVGPLQVEATVSEPHRLRPSHSNRLVDERDTAAGNTLRVVYEARDGGETAYVWTVIRIGRKRP